MNEIKIYTTGIKFTTQHQNDFQDGFLTKKTLNNTVQFKWLCHLNSRDFISLCEIKSVPTNIATKNTFSLYFT